MLEKKTDSNKEDAFCNKLGLMFIGTVMSCKEFPTCSQLGDFLFDPDSKEVYQYNGTCWACVPNLPSYFYFVSRFKEIYSVDIPGNKCIEISHKSLCRLLYDIGNNLYYYKSECGMVPLACMDDFIEPLVAMKNGSFITSVSSDEQYNVYTAASSVSGYIVLGKSSTTSTFSFNAGLGPVTVYNNDGTINTLPTYNAVGNFTQILNRSYPCTNSSCSFDPVSGYFFVLKDGIYNFKLVIPVAMGIVPGSSSTSTTLIQMTSQPYQTFINVSVPKFFLVAFPSPCQQAVLIASEPVLTDYSIIGTSVYFQIAVTFTVSFDVSANLTAGTKVRLYFGYDASYPIITGTTPSPGGVNTYLMDGVSYEVNLIYPFK